MLHNVSFCHAFLFDPDYGEFRSKLESLSRFPVQDSHKVHLIISAISKIKLLPVFFHQIVSRRVPHLTSAVESES